MLRRRTAPIAAVGAGALAFAGLAALPAAVPAAAPRCQAEDLTARVVDVEPGAGQRMARLVLVNRSDRACRTRGWVRLQLVDRRGRPLPTSTARVGGPAERVLLRPGQHAVSSLQWTVIATGDEPADGPCQPTPRALRVTPPGTSTSTTARWTQGPVCAGGRFALGPLRPRR